MVKPATPQARRGTKPGTTIPKNIAHVCPADGCPRNGEPFMGTRNSIYCLPSCRLRDWRKRNAAGLEAPA